MDDEYPYSISECSHSGKEAIEFDENNEEVAVCCECGMLMTPENDL